MNELIKAKTGLQVLAPFVLGTVLACGTVLEGVGLFFGVSVAFVLFNQEGGEE